MKNQKLMLADFQENQISKIESTRISGGRRIVTLFVDINGNCFTADGEPIQNPGNGSGIIQGVEYVFVQI